MAHQEQRHTRLFGGKRQLAAGHKIIGFCLALKLHKDGGKGAAAGGIEPGLQQALNMRQPHQCDCGW